MKTFDELLKLSEPERLTYLKQEVESVIARTRPENVLKMRALQSKIDRIRERIKNPLVSTDMIYSDMVDSLQELNNILNGRT